MAPDVARAALAAAITLARTSAYMPGEYFTEICREQTHPHFESEEEANAPQDTHHHPFISHKGKTSAKRACETIEVTWHMNMFDMDEICGGECPDEVAAPHHFFYDHKLSSLKIDAQHYRLERDLAQLLGDELQRADRVLDLALVQVVRAVVEELLAVRLELRRPVDRASSRGDLGLLVPGDGVTLSGVRLNAPQRSNGRTHWPVAAAGSSIPRKGAYDAVFNIQ